MTPSQAICIVAARLAAHAVDRDTAVEQVRVLLEQDARGDVAGTVLDVGRALVQAEARASRLAKDLMNCLKAKRES